MLDGFFGRFFQLGYVTRDLESAVRTLVDEQQAMLIDLIEDFKDQAGQPVVIRRLAHLMLGDAEIELIEPRLDWQSLYLEALPEKGIAMAFHHIGYMQPDVEQWEVAMARAEERGMVTVMKGSTPRARFAYLDTRAHNGHYSELVWRAPR